MLDITVDSSVIEAKLKVIPDGVRKSLTRQTYKTAIDLQRYIVKEHLTAAGGYSATQLHRKTGRLARSIQQQVTSLNSGVIGRVYSAGNIPYARIHEYGGRTSAHVIEAKNAKSLAFMMNGEMMFRRRVNHPGSSIPERSYMRASLKENKEKIVSDLTRAVKEGLKQS